MSYRTGLWRVSDIRETPPELRLRSDFNRYTNAETVGLCVFGLLVGLLLRLTHRYKGIQIIGLCVRIIGMGIVVYTATKVQVPTAAFAIIPVLIAFGGSCSVVGTRVASQASVPHQDLGQAIAQLALWTRLGGAVGSAIASTVWQSNMQNNMRREGVPAADIAGLYGSIRTARSKYTWGSENHHALVRGKSSDRSLPKARLTSSLQQYCTTAVHLRLVHHCHSFDVRYLDAELLPGQDPQQGREK
jgi:hypothetical protein